MDIHSKPEVAIPSVEYDMMESNGIRKKLINMRGWEVQIRWKDQSTYWVPLKFSKESNPIEAE